MKKKGIPPFLSEKTVSSYCHDVIEMLTIRFTEGLRDPGESPLPLSRPHSTPSFCSLLGVGVGKLHSSF